MKKIIYLLFFGIYSLTNAQEITGQWTTFDEATNTKKAIIEIYKLDNKYYGKIIKSYTAKPGKLCEKCTGDKYKKPIVNLVILEDLKKVEGQYTDGNILDPENGKTYDCNVELIEKNKLKVRGFIGFSLLGRTQYWQRLQ
ncbi:MAG: DUF2147 domain-containing protein [Wenyingzhuangia sp.]|jgi:uncharacterized protein (DUF2147 family)|uniref:DUF2147 domain-containing protein n=1 Tax=Wenyingzhuangia sp. TaxID=1964193 RepID=UPI00321C18D7